MKKQPLAPKGGNDNVFTPPELSGLILKHFFTDTKQTLLEPCAGNGSFIENFSLGVPNNYYDDWCEINPNCSYFNGKNFLFFPLEKYDWIITNPPWSQFRDFLNRSMELADNVVFLSLFNAWFMKARLNDIRKAGFGFKEALMLNTPAKPWPQTGFQLSAVHIQRGYEGDFKLNYDYL